MDVALLTSAAAELRKLSKEVHDSVPDWDGSGSMMDYQTWYNTRAEARMLDNCAFTIDCAIRNHKGA